MVGGQASSEVVRGGMARIPTGTDGTPTPGLSTRQAFAGVAGFARSAGRAGGRWPGSAFPVWFPEVPRSWRSPGSTVPAGSGTAAPAPALPPSERATATKKGRPGSRANDPARAAAGGRRAHHRCGVLGYPWPMDSSRAAAGSRSSSSGAASNDFRTAFAPPSPRPSHPSDHPHGTLHPVRIPETTPAARDPSSAPDSDRQRRLARPAPGPTRRLLPAAGAPGSGRAAETAATR